jgi:hypothetical protein
MKAFPLTFTNERGHSCGNYGMELRDYFAAKAMQALIAAMWDRHGADVNQIIEPHSRVSLHYRAYEHADAMMEARDAK